MRSCNERMLKMAQDSRTTSMQFSEALGKVQEAGRFKLEIGPQPSQVIVQTQPYLYDILTGKYFK